MGPKLKGDEPTAVARAFGTQALDIGGRVALERGNFAEARRLAGIRLAASADDAEGNFLLGMIEVESGRVTSGIRHLERAIAIAPRGEYRAQLARLYTLVRRDGDAAATLRAAETDPPGDALGRDTMGCAYARLGNHEAALPHFAAATALATDNDRFGYNHAATLSFLGRTEDAETLLEVILGRTPNDARAHHLLAGLRKQTPGRNHVTRLRAAHDRAAPGRDRLLTGYALVKELEDVGLVREAFERLVTINAAHRSTINYDIGRDTAIFDAIEKAWSLAAQSPATHCPADAPVLVIGMPRTGTTLVDRILSSHPDVESVGELQALPLAVKAASRTRSRTVLDPDTILAAAQTDAGAIGRDYLARATNHRQAQTQRFVDKFPGNFLYAGLAARALPNAKIVCLRRHPMDTILANFRNLFATGSRYYDYSYDLIDIAAYYARFDRLMAFWRTALPNRILELRYEALIDDQEGESRRLLAHCGLDWTEECLNFHNHPGAVSTPSAAQVRRPIYRDSMARWRQHADALAPARQYLAAQGIAVDQAHSDRN